MNQIPLEDLEDQRYYIGEGRFIGNPCVAMWNAKRQEFMGMNTSFEWFEVNFAEYGERGFSPQQSVVRIV